MKKKILMLLLVLIMPVMLLTGCGVKPEDKTSDKTISMFVLIENGDGYSVLYHRETKVMYIRAEYGTGSGYFTVMLNADGTPMLWEGEL